MPTKRVSALALGVFLLLAACASNTEQRAATGGLGGVIAGALLGGPIGAVAGGAAGAAAGTLVSKAIEYNQRSKAQADQSRQTEPGKFIVFFDLNEATLTPDGARVVAEAAQEYQETGAAEIVVTGHTDTSGSAAYNLKVSQRRAEVVANELIRRGVPATDITTVGRGEEDLLVPTADGVREPRNRRVEIVVPQPPPPPEPVASPAPVEPAP
jgi:outer membrane protein OmpA-like peptidoglycan-associated protein